MPHTFNPNTQEAKEEHGYEFKASLVYRASTKTARATQRKYKQTKQKKIIWEAF